MKHTFNSCGRRDTCEDPCNESVSIVWNEYILANPDVKKPNLDVCSLFGRCEMKPGSHRCLAIRCQTCKMWISKPDLKKEKERFEATMDECDRELGLVS